VKIWVSIRGRIWERSYWNYNPAGNEPLTVKLTVANSGPLLPRWDFTVKTEPLLGASQWCDNRQVTDKWAPKTTPCR
jgi:hypothetical protein